MHCLLALFCCLPCSFACGNGFGLTLRLCGLPNIWCCHLGHCSLAKDGGRYSLCNAVLHLQNWLRLFHSLFFHPRNWLCFIYACLFHTRIWSVVDLPSHQSRDSPIRLLHMLIDISRKWINWDARQCLSPSEVLARFHLLHTAFRSCAPV